MGHGGEQTFWIWGFVGNRVSLDVGYRFFGVERRQCFDVMIAKVGCTDEYSEIEKKINLLLLSHVNCQKLSWNGPMRKIERSGIRKNTDSDQSAIRNLFFLPARQKHGQVAQPCDTLARIFLLNLSPLIVFTWYAGKFNSPREGGKCHLCLCLLRLSNHIQDKSNQPKPNQTKPNQTKPNQTKPPEHHTLDTRDLANRTPA